MVMESSKPGGLNFTATQQHSTFFFVPFRFMHGAELKKRGLLKGFKYAKNSKKGRNDHFNN